ncbi:MAG TPA: hypothetical protein VF691_07575 [Cytophagaceae bacterium]|jgi:hypothetical protein
MKIRRGWFEVIEPAQTVAEESQNKALERPRNELRDVKKASERTEAFLC